MARCGIPKCTEEQWCKGYCSRHYWHIRRYGVPGNPRRRHSVREAIEGLISDPVVTMGKPEWTVDELAQRVNCCRGSASEEVLGLFNANRVTRRRDDGTYQQPGVYLYRWAQ